RTLQNKVLLKKGTGLTNFAAELKQILETSDESQHTKETNNSNSIRGSKLSKKSRIAQEREDLARFTIVSEHPDFKANPFEAMLNHLKTTVQPKTPSAKPAAVKTQKKVKH